MNRNEFLQNGGRDGRVPVEGNLVLVLVRNVQYKHVDTIF